MSNRLILIPKEKTESFIKALNDSIPSKEFMESCEKAGRLFNRPTNNTIDSEDNYNERD